MKILKRFGNLLLIAALVLSMVAIALAAEVRTFTDVPADAGYAQAVDWCVEHGLMNGVDDTHFDPDGSMTRAMLAAVLYRQAGEPAVTGSPEFSDAQPNVWYSDAVVWASGKGLLRGYGNGLFGVNDPVSREMLNAVIARQNGENPAWTGAEELAVDAKRSEAAVALYEAFAGSESMPDSPSTGAHILVAYFSATNNTESIANHIKDVLGEEDDIYEIIPESPYTSDDLNYNNNSSRANREQQDSAARPAINGTVANMEQYDVIFLGYPIWHGQAPRIMYTFVEAYDLTGKTIVPFCTSGSSSIGSSATNLAAVTTGADWLPGSRFSGSAGQSAVANWVNGLKLPEAEAFSERETNKMYIQVSGAKSALWTATLAENSSAAALKELLAAGPLTIEMSDYGSMEKVGPIGQRLPGNDEQISTSAGDIIL